MPDTGRVGHGIKLLVCHNVRQNADRTQELCGGVHANEEDVHCFEWRNWPYHSGICVISPHIYHATRDPGIVLSLVGYQVHSWQAVAAGIQNTGVSMADRRASRIHMERVGLAALISQLESDERIRNIAD